MQKTGTVSLYNYFEKNNIISTHDSMWWYQKDLSYFNKYDSFADGFERYSRNVTFPDLKFLEKNFKGSKFILQTRSLRPWLISRLRHGADEYRNGINTDCFDESVFLTWVNDRNFWYSMVYNYFRDKDNLLILDIESENKEKNLSAFLNIQEGVKFEQNNIKLNYTTNEREIDITRKIDRFLDDYIVKEDHNTKCIAKLKC